ncbi:unnamed protein product [Rhodiola kirilowii]
MRKIEEAAAVVDFLLSVGLGCPVIAFLSQKVVRVIGDLIGEHGRVKVPLRVEDIHLLTSV